MRAALEHPLVARPAALRAGLSVTIPDCDAGVDEGVALHAGKRCVGFLAQVSGARGFASRPAGDALLKVTLYARRPNGVEF